MKVEQIELSEKVERGSDHHYWGMVGIGAGVSMQGPSMWYFSGPAGLMNWAILVMLEGDGGFPRSYLMMLWGPTGSNWGWANVRHIV